jgi:hypothetical protein
MFDTGDAAGHPAAPLQGHLAVRQLPLLLCRVGVLCQNGLVYRC